MLWKVLQLNIFNGGFAWNAVHTCMCTWFAKVVPGFLPQEPLDKLIWPLYYWMECLWVLLHCEKSVCGLGSMSLKKFWSALSVFLRFLVNAFRCCLKPISLLNRPKFIKFVRFAGKLLDTLWFCLEFQFFDCSLEFPQRLERISIFLSEVFWPEFELKN